MHPPPTTPAGLPSGHVLALERLARLAARALRAPAAVLAQVDSGHGGWRVRAAHGVDPVAAEGAGLFYARVLDEPAGTLVFADGGRDDRSTRGPLVPGTPPLRAGLGVALRCPQGDASAGVLCVFDAGPRSFAPEDAAALADLAALAVDELERGEAAICGETELEARIRERTAALADAESRYRSIFENAVEGIYQSLPGRGFISVNPALARLLGYPSPEAMLAAVGDEAAALYVRPGRRAEFEARIRAEGALAGWESEARRADGSRLWISEHARAIHDEQGAVVRYEGTFEDITARKHAEEALLSAQDELEDRVRERTAELALLNGTLRQHIEEREIAEAALRRSESKFRALIENAQDLTSVLTPDGISLYQSPSIEHLLGHTSGELIGRNIFTEFIHPDDLPEVERAALAIVEGGERYVRVEIRCRHRDGSWRLLESISSATPPDSPVIGLVVNSRDITGRRRVETEHEARIREQTAVAALGRYALDERSLQDIFDKTAELVAQALRVPFCTVTERLPDQAKLLVRAGIGWRADAVGHAEVADWRRDLPGWPDAGTVKEVIIVDDLQALEGTESQLPPAEGNPEPRSAISVVVHCAGRRYGSLCALSPEPGRFGQQDALFLQTVADLLSAVIESERHKAASRQVQARYERIAAYTPGMVYQAIRRADGTGSVVFVSEG